MRIFVFQMKKSYYWTMAAVAVICGFWLTDFFTLVDIPTLGPAPIYHGNPNTPKMTLTVNVDWGEEFIPQMLSIFKEKGVRVTFFVTGRWAEKNPQLLQRMYTAGHEIGNHGYSHAHPNQLSEADLVAHLKNNEEILRRTLGIRPLYYAPPYGEYNKRVVQVAESLGYKVIMWSADTIDWQHPTPEVMNQRILSKASKGGIVLMHPVKETIAALPAMIDGLKAKGYELVPISENLSSTMQGVSDGS